MARFTDSLSVSGYAVSNRLYEMESVSAGE